MKQERVFLMGFIFFVLLACKKSDYSNLSFIEAEPYFALKKGAYVDFEAVSISHSPQTSNTVLSDTNYFYLRYQIGDTLLDNLGKEAYQFLVKRKDSVNELWNISDVWTANTTSNSCELVEENQRIVKLVSPIGESIKWNPNVYNSLTVEEFNYSNINEYFSLNSLNFDSTITVVQCDERNLIRYCQKTEKYAKHIGLIYKYYKDLEISNFDTLNIKSGSEFYLFPIGYGVE